MLEYGLGDNGEVSVNTSSKVLILIMLEYGLGETKHTLKH